MKSTTSNSIAWHKQVQQKVRTKHKFQTKSKILHLEVEKNINSEKDLLKLIDDTAQHIFFELAEIYNNSTRLFLLAVFFQASITIVLNVYNLVIFYIRLVDDPKSMQFSIFDALFFYGFNIYRSAQEVLMIVIIFSLVFKEINSTTRLINQFNLYARTNELRKRLQQFVIYASTNIRVFTIFDMYDLNGSLVSGLVSSTATYIIILTQYGMEFELKLDSNRTECLELQQKTFSSN